jgi:hypothetical protein
MQPDLFFFFLLRITRIGYTKKIRTNIFSLSLFLVFRIQVVYTYTYLWIYSGRTLLFYIELREMPDDARDMSILYI